MLNRSNRYHVYDGDECVHNMDYVPEGIWIHHVRYYIGGDIRTSCNYFEVGYKLERDVYLEVGYDVYGEVTYPKYYNVVDNDGRIVATIPQHNTYYGTDAVDPTLSDYYRAVALTY